MQGDGVHPEGLNSQLLSRTRTTTTIAARICSQEKHADQPKKANSVLGQLMRGVGYRDKKVFINLFKTYVRPHLEYCSASWSPWTLGDIEVLEAVQRRAVKAVTNVKAKSYEDKLSELGLDSLLVRRKRGDLIQMYKVCSGKLDVKPEIWFTMCDQRNGAVTTRRQGGLWNVVPPAWNGEIRTNFWSVRVCEDWNNLPDNVKQAKTEDCFKNRLDELRGWGKQGRGYLNRT